MSPFMFFIVLAVLGGAGVFVVAVLARKRKLMLVSAPAVLLVVIWYFLATMPPNPANEFDRLFGASNRGFASDIRTLKPTLMDGHFVSFHMSPTNFNAHVRSRFLETDLRPNQLLIRQQLPKGWPATMESAKSALHCEVDHGDVYLFYFGDEERAYVVVHYEQW